MFETDGGIRFPAKGATALAALAVLLLLTPSPAKAHDISLFDVGTRITLVLGQEKISYIFLVEIKNFPAKNQRITADADRDMTVSEAEAEKYRKEFGSRLISNLKIRVNDRPVEFVLSDVETRELAGPVNSRWFSIQIRGDIKRRAGEYHTRLEYENRNFTGEKTIINDVNITAHRSLKNLEFHPITVLMQYEDQERRDYIFRQMTLQREFTIEYGVERAGIGLDYMTDNDLVACSNASQTNAGNSSNLSWSRKLQNEMAVFMEESVNETLKADTLYAWALLLGIAFVVGVLHAIGPGHGKGVVASYIIGTRGTAGDALVLAGVVTIAHTLVVLAVAGIMIFVQSIVLTKYSNDAMIYGSFVAGVAVTLIGIYLLFFARTENWSEEEEKEEELVEELLEEKKKRRRRSSLKRIFAVGFTSGLVPCLPSLAALVICWRFGHVVKGFIIVLAMSLGTAVLLLGVGLMAVFGNVKVRKLSEKKTGLFGSAAAWIYPRLQKPMAVLIILFGLLIAWSAWDFLSRSKSAAAQPTLEAKIESLQNRIAENPDDWAPCVDLGLAYAATEDMGNALEYFKTALEREPTRKKALLLMGHVYSERGDFGSALDCYLRAGSDPETRLPALFNAAYANSMLGNSADAERLYRSVLKADPDHFKANYNLGVLLHGETRFDEAMEHFEKCSKLQPDRTEVVSALASTAAITGEHQRALGLYEELLEKRPGNLEARIKAANIAWIKLGDKPKSDSLIEKADQSDIMKFLDPAVDKLMNETVRILGLNDWEPPEAASFFSHTAPVSTSHLLTELDSANKAQKKSLVSAIGISGDPSAFGPLLDLYLEEETWEENPFAPFDERGGAVPLVLVMEKALQSCYRPEGIDNISHAYVLVAGEQDSREFRAKRFLLDLVGAERERLIKTIAEKLDDPSHSAKAAAAIGTFGVDGMKYAGTLVAMTGKGPLDVRKAAFKGLSLMASDQEVIIDAYCEGLKDDNPEIRKAAALAFAELGPGAEGYAEALKKAALDEEPVVRENMAFLLGVVEGNTADVLEKLIKDENPKVAVAALNALSMKEKQAEKLLPEIDRLAKESKNENVREAAADAAETIREYLEDE